MERDTSHTSPPHTPQTIPAPYPPHTRIVPGSYPTRTRLFCEDVSSGNATRPRRTRVVPGTYPECTRLVPASCPPDRHMVFERFGQCFSMCIQSLVSFHVDEVALSPPDSPESLKCTVACLLFNPIEPCSRTRSSTERNCWVAPVADAVRATTHSTAGLQSTCHCTRRQKNATSEVNPLRLDNSFVQHINTSPEQDGLAESRAIVAISRLASTY